MKRSMLYPLAWVLAVVLATGVGLLAVRTVGDTVRGRGPLGADVDRAADAADRVGAPARLNPDATVVQRDVAGDFGTFTVACQGAYASGLKAVADTGHGWRVVSFEPGPDDDVEAVFSNGRRSVEMEVFCNRGRPTVAEIERNQLPERE